ncbi:hypothetical protein NUW54_g2671 [Trametes sanguinea]|uniref:Uncharacterized protein n=1 Tax=Trametes sanguinea TaxID=158606 RepID=A0ACC1Q569_9APHY|nr:hypothetical protein NUW54_g2671 [Trametes sanguinea]
MLRTAAEQTDTNVASARAQCRKRHQPYDRVLGHHVSTSTVFRVQKTSGRQSDFVVPPDIMLNFQCLRYISEMRVPRRSRAARLPPHGPGHIKRPPNAFILYRAEQLVTFAPSASEDGRRHRQADLSKAISRTWNSLKKEQKQPWYDLAKEKASEHRKLYPEYVYRPRRRRCPVSQTSDRHHNVKGLATRLQILPVERATSIHQPTMVSPVEPCASIGPLPVPTSPRGLVARHWHAASSSNLSSLQPYHGSLISTTTTATTTTTVTRTITRASTTGCPSAHMIISSPSASSPLPHDQELPGIDDFLFPFSASATVEELIDAFFPWFDERAMLTGESVGDHVDQAGHVVPLANCSSSESSDSSCSGADCISVRDPVGERTGTLAIDGWDDPFISNSNIHPSFVAALFPLTLAHLSESLAALSVTESPQIERS